MLKVHFDAHAKPQVCNIEIDGNLPTILADITMVINRTYNTLLIHDEDAAEGYKTALKRAVCKIDHLMFAKTDMDDFKIEAMSYDVLE